MLQGPQGPYVYVIKADGTVETRLVTIGRSRNNQVLISKGLATGETVVTAGQYRSTEGTTIQVISSERHRGLMPEDSVYQAYVMRFRPIPDDDHC